MPDKRILYLTAEQWPTFRSDIRVLFGHFLPECGIRTDLLTELDSSVAYSEWSAGKAILCKVPHSRALQYVVKWLHLVQYLLRNSVDSYDAIQVRDMVWTACIALLIAKWHGKPFLYWLSYPQSEGQIERAKRRGLKAGIKFWFPLIQGWLGQWVLYRIVLPRTDFVFVQSDTMRKALTQKGVPDSIQYPVPMGVELEALSTVQPSNDARLMNRKVMVYLGTLDRVRNIELLLEVIHQLKTLHPEALLVIAGDTEDKPYGQWLRSRATSMGLEAHILWTGWLPMMEAWRYVKAARFGFSPFPRSYILDMASPTKAVEYLALGIPVIANDNPDQQHIIEHSQAGLCVPLTPEAFTQAADQLLRDAESCHQMAIKGLHYVRSHRGYREIAANLAQRYHTLLKS